MPYNGKYVQGVGWTLVVLGSLNIILGVIADVLFGVTGAFTIFHYISTPIWCGAMMVAFLVCGTVTIFFGITLLLIATIGALVDGKDCDREHKSYHNPCSSPAIALHAVNGALALAEIVIAFVGSIMSCSGLASPTVAYNQLSPNGQPSYVIVPPGAQGVPYPQQQVFVAQRPYPTQGYYGTMAPPPYAPAETKTQTPA
uniref:Uncharacterized protein n=1 Tax=Branchiostoma floridae TaxID=7739 RepID=C3Z2R9_BRAFL|eukprot:XP_002597308.1 hypothetical protein BRAFLDRAFT_66449 [Branchiostoma floridae]